MNPFRMRPQPPMSSPPTHEELLYRYGFLYAVWYWLRNAI